MSKSNDELTDAQIRKISREFMDDVKSDPKVFINNHFLYIKDGDIDKNAVEYLKSRGFVHSEELVKMYQLFCSNDIYQDSKNEDKGTLRLVIPIKENNEFKGYVARAINGYMENKVVNSKGTQIPLNIDYIKSEPLDDDKCLYICEGWADAFCFEDVGKKAISLNSVKNEGKFLKYLEAYPDTSKQYTYVFCLDNDDTGRTATTKFKQLFEKANFKYCELKIPPQFKDVNEWYKENKNIVEDGLKEFDDDNVLNYLDNGFQKEVELMEQFKIRRTGFSKLDKELNGIYPGLYTIGGMSSVGKTTFVHQMADQMAEQGEHVIYFSLEQSKLELVSKSISRQTYNSDKEDDLDLPETSIQIMMDSKGNSFRRRVIEKYKEYAGNIQIVQGNFDMTVFKIRNYVENYINVTGNRPIVFVDYLQILTPTNDRWSDKQQVDFNISELKRMSRDNSIPVFAICSFNRENYYNTASFTSFKESGGIEYGADVVIALQLKALNDTVKYTSVDEKKKAIDKAKSEIPRGIELVILKNRNGKAFGTDYFKYNPQYNYFKEVKEEVETYNPTPFNCPTSRAKSSKENNFNWGGRFR